LSGQHVDEAEFVTVATSVLRRTLNAVAAVIVVFPVVSGGGASALAQDFPVRPITLIVPWPAGGTTDTAIRALARSTERYLGQPIVTENRPGAGGTLAPMHMAATARPDGYTISQIPVSVIRASLLRTSTFNPAHDLSYVIGLTGYTFGIAVQSGAPWRTFDQLINDTKSGRKLTYASPGTGTTPHLTMERIARLTGADWVHVPFRGTAETVSALLGGHVDAIADATSWGSAASPSQLRLLVTWGAERTTNWPDVPTLREAGLDLVSNAPYGLAGPKGMPPNIVAILHDAFKRGMEEPAYLEALRRLDQEPMYLNSSDYRADVVRQIAEEEKLMSGFKPQ